MCDSVGERARRHHIIPRFYLQRFADGQGRVRQIWHPGDRRHLANVSNVSVVKDYYAVSFDEHGATVVSDYWEKAFSEVEDAAAAAFTRAIDEGTWPPSREDRAALVHWLTLQHLRNESARVMLNDLTALHYRMIVGINGIARLRQVMESSLDRPVGDAELEAEWEDLTQRAGPTVHGDPHEHIDTMRRVAGRMTDHFWACGIALCRFERRSLVTSDHPVVLFGTPRFPGGGLGLVDADFAMVPVSRRAALLLAPSAESDARGRGSTRMAGQFTAAVSAAARRWVALHPDDDPDDLDLVFHPPRTREIPSPDMESLIHRDRPIETTRGLGEYGDDVSPDRIPLVYPAWPLPRREFHNPHAPTETSGIV